MMGQSFLVPVTILGGGEDGWEGQIRLAVQKDPINYVKIHGEIYRLHRVEDENGITRTTLVHRTARDLIWPPSTP